MVASLLMNMSCQIDIPSIDKYNTVQRNMYRNDSRTPFIINHIFHHAPNLIVLIKILTCGGWHQIVFYYTVLNYAKII